MLISDPAILAVPVMECGERLLDVREDPALRVNARHSGRHDGYALVRQGVLDRLSQAQAALPEGLHLLLTEGYRPMALQREYFADYTAKIRAAHPDWPAEQVTTMASRFISPLEVAPHPAGAAVDVTLCTADGIELDLGTDIDTNPEDSGGACYFAAPQVIGPARANRDLLSTVLTSAGFVNYPTEWWHWSYGDRYWAHVTGAPHARYAPLPSRTVEQ